MQRNMVLFTAVFTVLVLAISTFTAFIFVISFHRVGGERSFIYWLGAIFSLLFIATFAYSRAKPTKIGSWFYIFVMTVAGYGIYLFLASIPLGLIISAFAISGKAMPFAVPVIFFSIGLVVGIIGHIQSWIVTIKRYAVSIPDLPEQWQNKTAVLITDTHFGKIRQERFARYIAKKVIALSPTIILHGGDFYDGPNIKTEGLTKIWRELANTIPIFYAPGNHEHFGDYDTFIASLKAANFVILENKKNVYEGLQIAGIDYHGPKDSVAADEAIKNLDLDESLPTILINHPPTFQDAAENAGVDLMVSGHTHRGQFWPGRYVTRRIYGVYHYGLQHYKTMTTITSRGVGTAGPPLRFLNSPELVLITFKK